MIGRVYTGPPVVIPNARPFIEYGHTVPPGRPFLAAGLERARRTRRRRRLAAILWGITGRRRARRSTSRCGLGCGCATTP